MSSSSSPTATHGVLFFLLLLLSVSVSAQSPLPPDPRSDPYQYRLSGSMAVIIVILIAALFFMAFFSVYIRHCNDSQSSNTVNPLSAAATANGRSRRATRGLDPALIDTFPTLIYSEVKEHKIGKSALECAVCLNEFEDDETLRLIPKCDHVFHPECIDAWLAAHSTCPVCRANLNPQLTESVHRVTDSNPESESELDRARDIEAQSDDVVSETNPLPTMAPLSVQIQTEPELNRNRTRRLRWLFPRSHSTGHSLVQPGEDTERFTLRLPVEIRKQVVNKKLNRATSMVVLARQSSSMRGYRFGSGEGSSRGKYYRRLERLDRTTSKSDRWVLSITPPFFTRMSSMKTPRGGGSHHGEAGLGQELGPWNSTADSSRLPV